MGEHYGRFPNLTRVTRQVFFENKFLHKTHRLGILNLTATARFLQPEIEKRTRAKTTPKIIAALLSRHTREISSPSKSRQVPVNPSKSRQVPASPSKS